MLYDVPWQLSNSNLGKDSELCQHVAHTSVQDRWLYIIFLAGNETIQIIVTVVICPLPSTRAAPTALGGARAGSGPVHAEL